MKTYAYDYRDERDLSKIIWMLENIVIKKGWDANIGVGPGDYAFGDIRIPAKCVPGFANMLRSLTAAPSLPPRLLTCFPKTPHCDECYRDQIKHDNEIRNGLLDLIQMKCNDEINLYLTDLDNPERMGTTKTAYRIRDYAESLRGKP